MTSSKKCEECRGRGLIQMRGISALCSCPTCGGRGFLPALATTTDRQQLDAGFHYPHQQGVEEGIKTATEGALRLLRDMAGEYRRQPGGEAADAHAAFAVELAVLAIEQGQHLKASESPDPEMMEAMP